MDWIHARSAWWGFALAEGILGFICLIYSASTGKKIKTEVDGVGSVLLSLVILLIVIFWGGWK